MKIIIAIVFLTVLSTPSLRGQEYKLMGRAVQIGNAELSFANILLYQMVDSSLVQGTISDEAGFFVFTNLRAGKYLLQASYIGNNSEFVAVDLDSDQDVGSLMIDQKAQELNEVVVVSKKPTVEQKVDRLVFHIENTALSESTIWEALKSTPSLFIMNDEITIKGEKGIQILINDRKVNLPPEDILNLLNGTAASGVQAIEVITTPPSKYDAEGGAMINIRMKKKLIAGYNGALYNRYVQGVFPQHEVGTNHYFKRGKWETSFNYSFGSRKELSRYEDITHFMENGQVAERWTSDMEVISKEKRHNASVFLDYLLDANNTISFSTIAQIRPEHLGNNSSRTGIQTFDGQDDRYFLTHVPSRSESLNTGFYLDYERKLNDQGAKFNMGSHYTYYDFDKDQSVETDFYDADGTWTAAHNFNTLNQQLTRLFSVNADFFTPLAKGSNLEAGIKYARTGSKSWIAQEGIDRNRLGIDPTEEGIFLYDESIYAAYAGFDTKWEKWSLKSGLRAEYTKTTGDFSLDATPIGRDYLELFPTLYLQFDPHEKHHFGLNYKRSLIRPDYYDINPFKVFQSDNSIIEGNIDLKPSYKNSLIFNYTFNKEYTFELFYRYHRNNITNFTFQDNENKLLRFVTDNSDRELALGIDFIYSKQLTAFWDTYLLSSYFYNAERFKVVETQASMDNTRYTFLLQFKNNFSLLEDRSLTINLDFTYISPIINANSKQEEYKEWNVALKKNLWNKKINISLGLSDIFDQFELYSIRKYGNQYNQSYYRPDSRMLTLGLRYNFGNMGLQDNSRSKATDEDDRL